MSEYVVRFPHALPRSAFSAREAARAGDVLRAFQDVAVEAATRRGWSPMRMRAVGSTWVVRSMTVVHHRETVFGEPLEGISWVRRTRRGTFSTREVRLVDAKGAVASASQEWAHITIDGPGRMPEDMEKDLGVHDEAGVELPGFESTPGPSFGFDFEVWEIWSDPIGHVNHPQYVDFYDEALSRRLRARDVDPLELVPVADQLKFHAEIKPRAKVSLRSALVGRTADGALVFDHRFSTATHERAAEARSIRRALGDPQAFLRAFTD